MHQITLPTESVRRSLGRELQVRVGLNSGDVALRLVGDEARLDYAVVPETTRAAAEMEQAARPGTSLITAATLQLAEGFVEVFPTEHADVFELSAASGARSRLPPPPPPPPTPPPPPPPPTPHTP